MIGHSLGCMETCFGPSTQGLGIQYQNKSQIQILLASHFHKKGRDIYLTSRFCLQPIFKKRGAILEILEYEWRDIRILEY